LDASQIDWQWRIEVPKVEASLECFAHIEEKYLVPEGTMLQLIESDNNGRIITEKILTIPVRGSVATMT
jgi:hypothetical protein